MPVSDYDSSDNEDDLGGQRTSVAPSTRHSQNVKSGSRETPSDYNHRKPPDPGTSPYKPGSRTKAKQPKGRENKPDIAVAPPNQPNTDREDQQPTMRSSRFSNETGKKKSGPEQAQRTANASIHPPSAKADVSQSSTPAGSEQKGCAGNTALKEKKQRRQKSRDKVRTNGTREQLLKSSLRANRKNASSMMCDPQTSTSVSLPVKRVAEPPDTATPVVEAVTETHKQSGVLPKPTSASSSPSYQEPESSPVSAKPSKLTTPEFDDGNVPSNATKAVASSIEEPDRKGDYNASIHTPEAETSPDAPPQKATTELLTPASDYDQRAAETTGLETDTPSTDDDGGITGTTSPTEDDISSSNLNSQAENGPLAKTDVNNITDEAVTSEAPERSEAYTGPANLTRPTESEQLFDNTTTNATQTTKDHQNKAERKDPPTRTTSSTQSIYSPSTSIRGEAGENNTSEAAASTPASRKNSEANTHLVHPSVVPTTLSSVLRGRHLSPEQRSRHPSETRASEDLTPDDQATPEPSADMEQPNPGQHSHRDGQRTKKLKASVEATGPALEGNTTGSIATASNTTQEEIQTDNVKVKDDSEEGNHSLVSSDTPSPVPPLKHQSSDPEVGPEHNQTSPEREQIKQTEQNSSQSELDSDQKFTSASNASSTNETKPQHQPEQVQTDAKPSPENETNSTGRRRGHGRAEGEGRAANPGSEDARNVKAGQSTTSAGASEGTGEADVQGSSRQHRGMDTAGGERVDTCGQPWERHTMCTSIMLQARLGRADEECR